MSIIDDVRRALSPSTKELEDALEMAKLERATLSMECDRLTSEADSLLKSNRTLETRVLNLEASLKKILNMFSREYSGVEQQMAMRTARAILEDDSWRK